MTRQETRYTPFESLGIDATIVCPVASECPGAPVVMRLPVHVYNRIEPNETSTFSLKVSESWAGDVAETPCMGGSVLCRIAWAKAGVAVKTRMSPANAGTTQNRPRRAALIRRSHYD